MGDFLGNASKPKGADGKAAPAAHDNQIDLGRLCLTGDHAVDRLAFCEPHHAVHAQPFVADQIHRSQQQLFNMRPISPLDPPCVQGKVKVPRVNIFYYKQQSQPRIGVGRNSDRFAKRAPRMVGVVQRYQNAVIHRK